MEEKNTPADRKPWSKMSEAEINAIKAKRCKKCNYRSGGSSPVYWDCDYLLITGHMRGCRMEDCEHYKASKQEVAAAKKEAKKFVPDYGYRSDMQYSCSA